MSGNSYRKIQEIRHAVESSGDGFTTKCTKDTRKTQEIPPYSFLEAFYVEVDEQSTEIPDSFKYISKWAWCNGRRSSKTGLLLFVYFVLFVVHFFPHPSP